LVQPVELLSLTKKACATRNAPPAADDRLRNERTLTCLTPGFAYPVGPDTREAVPTDCNRCCTAGTRRNALLRRLAAGPDAREAVSRDA
jgi:hypothetical protein